MGPGDHATALDLENAYELGKLIAQQGWVLLTGGRNTGVMDAASKGAKAANGLTVGILPGNNTNNLSEAVDIAIVTDMGNARNNINVLSSDVVIACGMGAGTASEISLAIKNHQRVILLNNNQGSKDFFLTISRNNIFLADTPESSIETAKRIVNNTY